MFSSLLYTLIYHFETAVSRQPPLHTHHSILYQRGIYPPESFAAQSKYGLSILVSTDDKLKQYLNHVLTQIQAWLQSGNVQQLVVVITGTESGETLERWVFNVQAERDATGAAQTKSSRPLKEIQADIAAIIRQITASVTFLPLLDEPCAFDLLVYTDKDAEVPSAWADSDPQYIANSTEVRLRSFTTSIHKVDAMVCYRDADEDDDI